ncbi:hypothetical protein [Aquimonas sp.]|jgi:hypothetical protein|uniref:hypothetical protein n=1 Tax=Aquimonas sp. TaxID=1872588 RepID=UPI0037BFD9B5
MQFVQLAPLDGNRLLSTCTEYEAVKLGVRVGLASVYSDLVLFDQPGSSDALLAADRSFVDLAAALSPGGRWRGPGVDEAAAPPRRTALIYEGLGRTPIPLACWPRFRPTG